MENNVIERMKEFLDQYNETIMRILYVIRKEDDKRTEESGIDNRDSIAENNGI